ncbi:type III pantothenate kinase [Leptolyngbya sp. PCC 6406]|uniref:type III pantothenate kinase n=1 Tax=Leptolyngbya sp. PCC 6406 TaxID=1173264 RepID=UPI0002ABFC65|nr:type III pantothenate kinase [Leptolyngbya sp. PCC 6406]
MAAIFAAPEHRWLALIVGNTRLHWGAFAGGDLLMQWHSRHLQPEEAIALYQSGFASSQWGRILATATVQDALEGGEQTAALLEQDVSLPPDWGAVPLYSASVVPHQTVLWQEYFGWREITLENLPLGNLYPTLGIDRALNLLGAGARYGWPVLVVDGGTALTFTAGGNGQKPGADPPVLLGGAILPGVGMQFRALGQHTAALPTVAVAPPDRALVDRRYRWATDTPSAIRSGILHSIAATVEDYLTAWATDFPQSSVVFTGGDGGIIYDLIHSRLGHPVPIPGDALAASPQSIALTGLNLVLYHDSEIPFWGLQQARAWAQDQSKSL